MNQCQFTKPNREKCNAYAVKNDVFCFAHSQKHKEEYTQAIHKGGKSLKRSYIDQPPILLRNNEDIVYLIEQTINSMRENKISTKTASVTAMYINLALKAIPLAIKDRETARTNKMLNSGEMDTKLRIEKQEGEIRQRQIQTNLDKRKSPSQGRRFPS